MNSTLLQFSHISQSAEDRFWAWFVANEARLYESERDEKRIFTQLGSKLQQIDANLTFRFCEVEGSDRREFIVSASGIKRSFWAVERLASKAPSLARWKVTAFRPRTGAKTVESNGLTLDSSQVYFSHSYGENKIGLKLYIEGYAAATRVTLVDLAFLLLDDTIGEYDVATKIGYVDVDRLPRDPKALGLRPFADLPDVIDNLSRPAAT